MKPSLTTVQPGVWYDREEHPRISGSELDSLIDAARRESARRARICLHRDRDDPVHEMVICLLGDSYVRPHRHFKDESLHWMAGEADLVLLAEDGSLTEAVRLGGGVGQVRMVRLRGPVFHTILVRSEYLLFHETTRGPLRVEDTEYASWSPAPGDETVATYLRQLETAVRERAR